MLATTVLALFALYASVADAGFDARFRAHTPHKRAALSLRPRSSKPQQCKLTPFTSSTTKISHATSTTSATGSGPTGGGGGGGGNGKTITGVTSAECGDPNATVGSSKGVGPNGQESWLDCGVNTNSGWNPPNIQISNLIYVDLAEALQQNGTPFTACNAYLQYFNSAASKYGIPAILLASIALQESSCDPNAKGAGTWGLMQITTDKCPNNQESDCFDPQTNIDIGSAYFADTLAGNGGNVALTLGQYNGWYKGMTVSAATAAAHSSCCTCQQNLDYLHQTFNGWIMNIDAYAAGLGTYQNLATC